MSSAGLAIVANIVIATGSASWGPRGPLREICSSIYAMVDVRIKMPEENSQKGGPIFCTCYTETFFVETKVNFSFWEFASA